MVGTAKQISINGVVEGGVKLSLLLNAVGCEASSAEVDIHIVAKAISLFALDLKHIGRGFQAADSPHSGDALSTARKIAVQGRVIFDEIEQMLDKARETGGYSSSPDLSLTQRFSQSFKPHRVTYLLAHLESLQLSLMVMSLVLQIGRPMAAQRHGDSNRRPPTSETIQQERVDAQNMVVVRHWSVNRLNELYSLSKREAYPSHNDENPTPGKRSENPALSPPPYQLPVIPLVESENSPPSMKGSPRDMVRESASIVDQLVSLWIRQDASTANSSGTPATKERDRNLGGTSEPNLQGCYMNGTTNDWRRPVSPAPRKSATRVRDRYPAYQPRVDSDSESSDSGRSRQMPRQSNENSAGTSDGNSSVDGHRTAPRGKADFQKNTRPKEPDDKAHLYPQGTEASRSDWNINSRTAPRSNTSSKRSPIPTSQYQQNKNGAYHPTPFPPQYQHQHQHPPPLHYELPQRRTSSPSRHSRRGSSSSRDYRSSYDSSSSSRDERHRRLKRNATKGILGIGALAGFLAALEGL